MALPRRWRWGIGVGLVAALGVAAWLFLRPGSSDLLPPTDNAAALNIPRTFDDPAMASLEVPLARPDASPLQVTSHYYYRLGIRPTYNSYSVYSKDREPPGYIDRLRQEKPQVLFQTGALKTTQDWIKAGELVFEALIAYGHIAGLTNDLYARDPEWESEVAPSLVPNGTIPGLRYVVRTKGEVEIGILSCAMCHSRVMPDGTLIKGAQGNFL
jgi:hypothetical protein